MRVWYCYECSSRKEEKEIQTIAINHGVAWKALDGKVALCIADVYSKCPQVIDDGRPTKEDIHVSKDRFIFALKHYRAAVALELLT